MFITLKRRVKYKWTLYILYDLNNLNIKYISIFVQLSCYFFSINIFRLVCACQYKYIKFEYFLELKN